MSYRPKKEWPEMTEGQKRRRKMQDKRDHRYDGKSHVIDASEAAHHGLPHRKSMPAEVVTHRS